jgi:hypothetical protein
MGYRYDIPDAGISWSVYCELNIYGTRTRRLYISQCPIWRAPCLFLNVALVMDVIQGDSCSQARTKLDTTMLGAVNGVVQRRNDYQR